MRTGRKEDFEAILEIVNDAAQAYRGVILWVGPHDDGA